MDPVKVFRLCIPAEPNFEPGVMLQLDSQVILARRINTLEMY